MPTASTSTRISGAASARTSTRVETGKSPVEGFAPGFPDFLAALDVGHEDRHLDDVVHPAARRLHQAPDLSEDDHGLLVHAVAADDACRRRARSCRRRRPGCRRRGSWTRSAAAAPAPAGSRCASSSCSSFPPCRGWIHRCRYARHTAPRPAPTSIVVHRSQPTPMEEARGTRPREYAAPHEHPELCPRVARPRRARLIDFKDRRQGSLSLLPTKGGATMRRAFFEL